MGGEYTRMTFDPELGYTSVREQQGRVRLDSDCNEYGDVVDRRIRAETLDILDAPPGVVVVPDLWLGGVQLTTSFAIGVAGGEVTVAPGRAYVDGILVECWGDAPTVYDERLGENRGTTPLTAQPFAYSPNFPVPAAAGTSLVYLDVWSREVTALEQPALKDRALGGLDTATRMQTAWQVKVLNGVAATDCASTPPQWTSLIAPPTGRLTAKAPPGTQSNLPCTIDPVGGYTGLENRLYRVQIYQTGTVIQQPPGTVSAPFAQVAQFLWSDENAAVGQRVLQVTPLAGATPASTLQFSTVGRDAVLRFQVNDVLEYLDDDLEFSIRERNQGGPLVHVTAVHPEAGTVDIDADLSAGFNANRNPRVRRWSADPAATQLAPVQIGSVGIQVSFGPGATDTLRAGDYWVFAARTVDGTIDELDAAPPLGTLHHYAKLALLTNGVPTSDCRTHWPPGEGCCTRVVWPGEDLQAAIDSIPPRTGGCICLKAGVHSITAPLRIFERRRLVIHAEAPLAAVVRNTVGIEVVDVQEQVQDVRFADVAFEGTVPPGAPGTGSSIGIMQVVGAARIAAAGCSFGLATGAEGVPDDSIAMLAPGVSIWSTSEAVLEYCTFHNVVVGARAVQCSGLRIEGCRCIGPVVLAAAGPGALGTNGIWISGTTGLAIVADNDISDYASGIFVGPSEVPVIRGNRIARRPLAATRAKIAVPVPIGSGAPVGLTVTATAGGLASLLTSNYTYGIECHAPGAAIADNVLDLTDPTYGGILILRELTEVRNNSITSSTESLTQPPAPLSPGIALVPDPTLQSASLAGASVSSNVLTGPMTGIVVLGGVSIEQPRAQTVRVTKNAIDIGLSDPIDPALSDPIDPAQFIDALVRVTDGVQALTTTAGIFVSEAADVRVECNEIRRVTAGIAALQSSTRVEVLDNSVSMASIGIVGESAWSDRWHGNRIDLSNCFGIVVLASAQIEVSGNTITTPGTAAMVEFASWNTQYRGNSVVGGGDGLVIYSSGGGSELSLTALICDNSLSNLSGVGIAADGDAVECSGNSLSACCWGALSPLVRGLFAWAPGAAPPVSAAMVLHGFEVSVNDCAIHNTGSSGNVVYDIYAVALGELSITGTTITQSLGQPQPLSLGVYGYCLAATPDAAHVSFVGNRISVTYPQAVRLSSATTPEGGMQIGSAVLASNMIGARQPIKGTISGVVGAAFGRLSVTGNHVATGNPRATPFSLAAGFALSAVGNTTEHGNWRVTSGLIRPAPLADFNVIIP